MAFIKVACGMDGESHIDLVYQVSRTYRKPAERQKFGVSRSRVRREMRLLRFGVNLSEGESMKKILIAAAFYALILGGVQARQDTTAKQDAKDAGSDTSQAAKKTGSATKKTAKKAVGDSDKKPGDTTAKQDIKAAGSDTKGAAKDTGSATKKGTKKAVNKTAQKTDEGAQKVEEKTKPN
jgi:hypothetical protein